MPLIAFYKATYLRYGALFSSDSRQVSTIRINQDIYMLQNPRIDRISIVLKEIF